MRFALWVVPLCLAASTAIAADDCAGRIRGVVAHLASGEPFRLSMTLKSVHASMLATAELVPPNAAHVRLNDFAEEVLIGSRLWGRFVPRAWQGAPLPWKEMSGRDPTTGLPASEIAGLWAV